MEQPVPRRNRPASRRGLTSPDRSPTPTAHAGRRPVSPSGTQDKPQDSKRPEDDARQQSNINSLGQRARKRSPEFTRWIEAKLGLS